MVQGLQQEADKLRAEEHPPPPPTEAKVAKQRGWQEIKAAEKVDKKRRALGLVCEEIATLQCRKAALEEQFSNAEEDLQRIREEAAAAAKTRSKTRSVAVAAEKALHAHQYNLANLAAEAFAAVLANHETSTGLVDAVAVKADMVEKLQQLAGQVRLDRLATNGLAPIVLNIASDDDNEAGEDDEVQSDDECMAPDAPDQSPARNKRAIPALVDEDPGYQSIAESGPDWQVVQTKKERRGKSASRSPRPRGRSKGRG